MIKFLVDLCNCVNDTDVNLNTIVSYESFLGDNRFCLSFELTKCLMNAESVRESVQICMPELGATPEITASVSGVALVWKWPLLQQWCRLCICAALLHFQNPVSPNAECRIIRFLWVSAAAVTCLSPESHGRYPPTMEWNVNNFLFLIQTTRSVKWNDN